MRKQKPKPPNLKVGEGDYTEARKEWIASLTLEDLRREREKSPDSKLLAELERAKKRKRKAS